MVGENRFPCLIPIQKTHPDLVGFRLSSPKNQAIGAGSVNCWWWPSAPRQLQSILRMAQCPTQDALCQICLVSFKRHNRLRGEVGAPRSTVKFTYQKKTRRVWMEMLGAMQVSIENCGIDFLGNFVGKTSYIYIVYKYIYIYIYGGCAK